jgi:secretion/DNA translocation related TadE-like protein
VSRSRRTDRGSASVMVLALAGVLLLLGAALGVVAAMVAAHRTAQAAADLAALAGARTLADGGDPCAAAGAIATANGAAVTGCAVEGRDVRVQVLVTGPRWLGQEGDLAAEARAGPVAAAS